MKKLLLSLTYLITFLSYSQDLNLNWAFRQGGTYVNEAKHILTDNSGNVYAIGRFTLDFDFDPGPGVTSLNGQEEDIYIQKLSAGGQLIWVKQITGTYGKYINSVCIDNSGNIYLSGFFSGVVDFNPGTAVSNLTNVANADGFLLKLNQNGVFQWVKQVGSATGNDYTQGLVVSVTDANAVYAVDDFTGSISFASGTQTVMLNAIGNRDLLIRKFDSNGSLLWYRQIGNANATVSANSGALDNNGNLLLTGQFSNTIDFNPGLGVSNLTAVVENQSYLLKIDPFAEFDWAKKYDGIVSTRDLKSHSNGRILVTGVFEQNADFDLGNESEVLTSLGGNDFFLQHLDNNGNLIWVKHMGGTGDAYNPSISVAQGSVYFGGGFNGTIYPDPELSNNALDGMSNGILMARFSMNGDLLWGEHLSSSAISCYVTDITSDNQSNLYLTGNFNGSSDFDPGNSVYTLSSNSQGQDIFVMKMTPGCSTPLSVASHISCSPYTWTNGVTYYNSAIDYQLFFNQNGCDSLVKLEFSLLGSAPATDSHTSCEPFTWIDGITYTASNNTASFTIPNGSYLGCDSIVNLELFITDLPSFTSDEIVANSYLWPVNNQIYTQSGTYTDTVEIEGGCDEVYILDLTITELSTSVFTTPSEEENCTGSAYVSSIGTPPYMYNAGNGILPSSTGDAVFTELCPGVYTLYVQDGNDDTITTVFVVASENETFVTNPTSDAVDTLTFILENCDIDYATVDTAYIESYTMLSGDSVFINWVVADAQGITTISVVYLLSSGDGNYDLQLQLYCPEKSTGNYLVATHGVNFSDGDISLSNADLENPLMLSISPNPTSDKLTIRFEENSANLIIHDVNGKQLLTKKISSNEQIDISEFASGVYLFGISTEKGSVVKRVVKN